MQSEQQPNRPAPQSTVQAAGRVAEDVVSGLRQQPVMLGLVVLNIVAIIAAVWFLGNVTERNAANIKYLYEIVKSCISPHGG